MSGEEKTRQGIAPIIKENVIVYELTGELEKAFAKSNHNRAYWVASPTRKGAYGVVKSLKQNDSNSHYDPNNAFLEASLSQLIELALGKQTPKKTRLVVKKIAGNHSPEQQRYLVFGTYSEAIPQFVTAYAMSGNGDLSPQDISEQQIRAEKDRYINTSKLKRITISRAQLHDDSIKKPEKHLSGKDTDIISKLKSCEKHFNHVITTNIESIIHDNHFTAAGSRVSNMDDVLAKINQEQQNQQQKQQQKHREKIEATNRKTTNVFAKMLQYKVFFYTRQLMQKNRKKRLKATIKKTQQADLQQFQAALKKDLRQSYIHQISSLRSTLKTKYLHKFSLELKKHSKQSGKMSPSQIGNLKKRYIEKHKTQLNKKTERIKKSVLKKSKQALTQFKAQQKTERDNQLDSSKVETRAQHEFLVELANIYATNHFGQEDDQHEKNWGQDLETARIISIDHDMALQEFTSRATKNSRPYDLFYGSNRFKISAKTLLSAPIRGNGYNPYYGAACSRNFHGKGSPQINGPSKAALKEIAKDPVFRMAYLKKIAELASTDPDKYCERLNKYSGMPNSIRNALMRIYSQRQQKTIEALIEIHQQHPELFENGELKFKDKTATLIRTAAKTQIKQSLPSLSLKFENAEKDFIGDPITERRIDELNKVSQKKQSNTELVEQTIAQLKDIDRAYQLDLITTKKMALNLLQEVIPKLKNAEAYLKLHDFIEHSGCDFIRQLRSTNFYIRKNRGLYGVSSTYRKIAILMKNKASELISTLENAPAKDAQTDQKNATIVESTPLKKPAPTAKLTNALTSHKRHSHFYSSCGLFANASSFRPTHLDDSETPAPAPAPAA